MKIKLLLLLLLVANYSMAQQQIKKLLFIGNSYTAVNDLPALLVRFNNLVQLFS
jgi:hypothetical protein